MAFTSVKLTVDSSDYSSKMRTAKAQMKELSSEYSVAETKAKLFGSAADTLKAKSESLNQKIQVQQKIVKMNSEEQKRLTDRLGEQRARQEKLAEQIETTKKAYEEEKRVTGENSAATKTLKEELDKLENGFKINETAIGKTQIALENQTVKVNQSNVKLMEMQAELEQVNKELKNHKLNEFADACDKAGEKVENFGKKMTVVSAGIAGLAAASVKSFNEMKEGYDIIVTKTGATGDALDDLKSSADNVFGDMPEDMSTVGEAVGEVNTRFHTTGKELEKTSKLFVQFASINDTQVTQSVDQVDKIMKAWNVDTSQTGNILGLLTQKAQDTGISVDKLESYVLDNNAALKEMNLSLPQAINLMAQFDANGVDSTQAIAGLKKGLQNATDEGKSLDAALNETIGSIKRAKSDTEALQIATELFGKKGAAEMATAIKENRINLTGLSASLSEYGNVVETTYNNTKSPMDDAKVAMNNIKLALSDMGDTALSAAAPAINELTEDIKEITTWFTSLDKGQQQTILKIGLFTAAIGPATVGIGKFAQGISSTIKFGQDVSGVIANLVGKITAKTAATTIGTAADTAGTAAVAAHTAATTAATTVTGGMTVAQTALNLAMSLCPVLAIVAGISALIAGGVALYKNWDAISEKASEIWGNVNDTISKFSDAAEETVKQNLSNMKQAYEENGGGIKGIVAAGWEGIKGYYTAGFTFIDKLTGGKLSDIKKKFKESGIGKAASNIFENANEMIRKNMDAAEGTVKQNLSNIKQAYEENGGGIKGAVAAGVEGIRGYYTSGLTYIDNLTDGKLSGIREKFSSGLTDIKISVAKKIDELKKTAAEKMKNVRSEFSVGWEDTEKKVVSTVKQTTKIVDAEWGNTNNFIKASNGMTRKDTLSTWKSIKESVKKAVVEIRKTSKTEFDGTEKNSSDAWSKIQTNIKSRIETAKEKVEKAVANIREKLSFENVKNTVKEIWEGIKDEITKPIREAKENVEEAIQKIKDIFDFKWSLPKIPLPHFKITGSFKLNPPSTPKFDVEWYRTGGIMTRPTIFGMNGSRLMVGGESGAEAILPLEQFYTRLGGILDNVLKKEERKTADNVSIVMDVDSILDRLDRIEGRVREIKLTEIIQIEPDDRGLYKIVKRVADMERDTTGNPQYI